MCIFLPSFLGTLQNKTLKLVKAQNLISVRFSEVGENQNINNKLPFRKLHIWGAGHQEQHWCEERKRHLPLSHFATRLGLATLCLMPPPKLIARW